MAKALYSTIPTIVITTAERFNDEKIKDEIEKNQEEQVQIKDNQKLKSEKITEKNNESDGSSNVDSK